MRRNHLSLIFYFVINIVIFTSRAKGDESFYERSGNEADKVNDEGEDETSKLMLRGTHFHRSDRYKFRRDSPYSDREQETNNNEFAGGKDSFDDAGIRYILEHLQTRDVDGQTAVTTSKTASDTFNGKLIPCFIHCSLSPKSKIYCFVFLLFAGTTASGNNKADVDLSKTPINNTTFDERPAATSSIVTNNKSNELESVVAALDVIREELEIIRMSKECNSTPDGSNCDVNGSWNSEQIGLKFELSTVQADNKLTVKLGDKAPKKMTSYKIDASWNCSGFALHSIGGPLMFFCVKPPLDTIAIFQGACKKCSGYETVFGKWHFQQNPKDCRQMWTLIESKNDILRKDVLHHTPSQQRQQQRENGNLR
jgi:hypothetical protein